MLNSFVNNGFLIPSQDSELIDRFFLESMIVKTILSNKPFGEKKDMHSAEEGRKWSVLL